MPSWTHLVRFVAVEDEQIHLGQLVDTTIDTGLASFEGKDIKVYLINGDIFTGTVTQHVYTVKRLLSPVSREQCNYIRCLGLNYKDHAKEASMGLPEHIEVFTKPRSAITDPFPSAITVPKCAQDGTSDYEAELCLVIGKTGRDIPESEAMDYVLGYTASNDVSARALQLATKQWSFGKGLDNSCPLGPALVSASAIGDPHKLEVKAVYNGRVLQHGQTSDMVFHIKKQISSLSRGTTLEAGTIILTGTPAGIGYFQQPRVYLEDGSDVRVEIPGIGTLINKVKYEAI